MMWIDRHGGAVLKASMVMVLLITSVHSWVKEVEVNGNDRGFLRPIIDTSSNVDTGSGTGTGGGRTGGNLGERNGISDKLALPKPGGGLGNGGSTKPGGPSTTTIGPVKGQGKMTWNIRFTRVVNVEVMLTWMDIGISDNCTEKSLSINAVTADDKTVPLTSSLCGSISSVEENLRYCLEAKTIQVVVNLLSGLDPRPRIFSLYYQQTNACADECVTTQSFTDYTNIISPNFEKNIYPALQHCNYTLKVTSGQIMKIEFVYFEVDSSPSSHCSRDALSLYDVTSVRKRPVGVFCGEQTDLVVYSGHETELTFRSDGIPSTGGFKLKVTAVTPATPNTLLPFLVDGLQHSGAITLQLQDYPDEFVFKTDTGHIYQWLIRGLVPSSHEIDWSLEAAINSTLDVILTFFDGPTDEFSRTKISLSSGKLDAGRYIAKGFYSLVKLETFGDSKTVLNMTVSNVEFNEILDTKCYSNVIINSKVSVSVTPRLIPDCSPQSIYREILLVVEQPYRVKLPISIEVLFNDFPRQTSDSGDCTKAGFVIIDDGKTLGPFCGSSDEGRFKLLRDTGYISVGSMLRIVFFQYVSAGHLDFNWFRFTASTSDCQGVLWTPDVISVHPHFGERPVCLQSIGYPSGVDINNEIEIKPIWNGKVRLDVKTQDRAAMNCNYMLLLNEGTTERVLTDADSAASYHRDINGTIAIKRKWADCGFDFVHFILKIEREDKCMDVNDCNYQANGKQATCGRIIGIPPTTRPQPGGNPPTHSGSDPTCSTSIQMINDADTNSTLKCTSGEYIWQYEITVDGLKHFGLSGCTTITELVSATGCTSSDKSARQQRRVHARWCDSGDDIGPGDTPRVIRTIGPQFRITRNERTTISLSYKLVKIRRNLLPSPDPKCTCQKEYIQYRCNCYSFNPGRSLSSGISTWHVANKKCAEDGGRLTSIVNAEEMNAIWEMIWGEWWSGNINSDGLELDWIFIGIVGKGQDFTGQTGHRNSGNTWIDREPFTYSEWYRRENSGQIRVEPRFVIDERDQPSPSDSATQCGAMYFHNVYQYSNWFKIPCAVPLNKASYICKKKAESTGTSKVFFDAAFSQNETLAVTGNFVCPKGWNFADGVCLMMLNSKSEHQMLLDYDDADDICGEHSGSVAMGNQSMSYWYNIYMDVWMHLPIYGSVWLRQQGETDYYLSYSDQLQRWTVQDDTQSNPVFKMTHVLCERQPLPFSSSCGQHQYQCADGSACLIIDRRCDGVRDCSDGSDESSCDLTPVSNTSTSFVWGSGTSWYFACLLPVSVPDYVVPASGRAGETSIPISRLCDHVNDCSLKSGVRTLGRMRQSGQSLDEACGWRDCNSTTEFMCSNGQCIPLEKRCDLINDCFDWSDEGDCEDEGACKGFSCYAGTCLAKRTLDDMFVDCRGLAMEDEAYKVDLSLTGLGSHEVRVTNASCPSGHSRCRDDHPYCFPRSDACVYDRDHFGYVTGCRDMAHLRNCKEFQCPGMFQCSSGYCLPQHLVCDGMYDCPEGQDERDCPTKTCPGALKCGGSDEYYCVEQSLVCDGVRDCVQSGDDERFCDIPQCHPRCQCEGYVVDCTGAYLTSVPDISLSTRILVFPFNRAYLSGETLDGLFLMAHLNLSNNAILELSDGTFKHLQNLIELDLSGNLLTALNAGIFSSLAKLSTLLLSGNPLQVIQPGAFQGLFNLPSLELDNCNIQELQGNLFAGLEYLTTLSLRNSSIVIVAPNAFDGLENMQSLDLRENQIFHLTPDVFRNLSSLSLLNTDLLQFCCAYFEGRDGGESTITNSTCYPSPDQFSSCKDLLKWTPLTVIVWILGILAFVMNAFVIVWRLVKERNNVVNILVLNLGLSDFLMSLYLLIIAIADSVYRNRYASFDAEWRNSGFCTAASILSTLSSEMSVLMLVVITADRVITIMFTYKLQRLNLKKTGVIIATAWLVSIFIAVLPLFGGSYFDGFLDSNAVCLSYNPTVGKRNGWEFATFILSLNLLAFIFILVSYCAIYRHYLKSKAALAQLSSSSTKSKEIALAKKMIFILASDFLCWVPIISVKFASLAGVLFPEWAAPLLAVVILPLNSSLNPLLYTVSALMDDRKNRKKKKKYASANTTETDPDRYRARTPRSSPYVTRANIGERTLTPNGSPIIKRSPLTKRSPLSAQPSAPGTKSVGLPPLARNGGNESDTRIYDNHAFKGDAIDNVVLNNNAKVATTNM